MHAGAKIGLAAMAAVFAGAVHAGSNVTAASMDTATGKSQSAPKAMGPDVSKVPAPPAPFVPVPYPNTPLDQPVEGAPTAKKPESLPVLKNGSTYIKSTGDEAGTAASQTSVERQPFVVTGPSTVIKSEGAPVMTFGSPTFHNATGGAPAASPPPTTRTPPPAPPPAIRAERAVRQPLILQQQPGLHRRP